MTIDFTAFTDGDFYLDKEHFDKLLKNYDYCEPKYAYYEEHDYFHIRFTIELAAEDNDASDLWIKMAARDFIEKLVKSIRFNHMFIMKYLYELNEEARHWIYYSLEEDCFSKYWSGNYDGTELVITR